MNLLWTGSVIGAVVGCLHAAFVYRSIVNAVPAQAVQRRARGIYYAVWTLALWILCGSYILILWLIAVIFYAGSRVVGKWK